MSDDRGETPTANESERRRWNDAYWTSVWPRREALTDNVTPDLLAHVGARTGDAVLDIGSGGGKGAIAVGRHVGPEGRVVGADVSEPLVRLARERASQSGSDNVRFELVDAQKDDIGGAPFSVAMSQFGVMFFDEPATAFANIARHVGEGGRLVVVCWQAMDRNPWALGHAIGAYAPPPPTRAPGKSLTGPFTLGDFTRTAELLSAAGWEEPDAVPYERIVTVDRAAIFDDGQLAFNCVAAEDLPAARDAVDRHLARFLRADGQLDVPIAYFVVTARKRRGAA